MRFLSNTFNSVCKLTQSIAFNPEYGERDVSIFSGKHQCCFEKGPGRIKVPWINCRSVTSDTFQSTTVVRVWVDALHAAHLTVRLILLRTYHVQATLKNGVAGVTNGPQAVFLSSRP